MSIRQHRSHRKSRESAPVVSFWSDTAGVSPAVFLLTCVVFSGGLLFGGSGGSFGDTIVQLLALPLIVLAAMHWSQSQLRAGDWAALAIIVGIAVLAFVQLVPLPLSIWAALPGRADLLREMQSVGVTPAWQSLSLNPYTTERALLWTLPAIAMFLAVRWMSSRQRRVLLLLLFFGAIGLLILAFVQRSAPQSDAMATANNALAKATFALRSLQKPEALPASHQFVTGLFSNRNHFATFLAMTIPLVIAMGIEIWLKRSRGQPNTWVPLAALLVLVVMGLLGGMFETHSRAALVLGGLSLLGSMALLRHIGLNRLSIWAIVALTFAGALLAFQMAASQTLARLDQSPDIDLRWQVHTTTLQAAHRFGPLGSGLGTFVQAYQTVQPEKDFGPQFINRAHSDYHELWLETGVPGALLIVCFLAWFGWSSWRVWRNPKENSFLTLIARAATLSILMVLLHSYLDYPLRKTAILVAFGMSCALLAPTNETTVQRAHHRRIAKA